MQGRVDVSSCVRTHTHGRQVVPRVVAYRADEPAFFLGSPSYTRAEKISLLISNSNMVSPLCLYYNTILHITPLCSTLYHISTKNNELYVNNQIILTVKYY
jgi:hypothetical protein